MWKQSLGREAEPWGGAPAPWNYTSGQLQTGEYARGCPAPQQVNHRLTRPPGTRIARSGVGSGSRVDLLGDLSLCPSHLNPLLQFLKSSCPFRSDTPPSPLTLSLTACPPLPSVFLPGGGFGVLRRLVLVCLAGPFPPWKLLPTTPSPPRYVSPKAKASGRGARPGLEPARPVGGGARRRAWEPARGAGRVRRPALR